MILSEQDCKQLFAALQHDFTWRWDERFKMPLAEINKADKGSLEAMLEDYFGTPWNKKTVETAPETIQKILVPMGGLMPSQLLYVSGLQQEGIIFCAWWPWGNGQTISVRIGTTKEASDLLAELVPLDAR